VLLAQSAQGVSVCVRTNFVLLQHQNLILQSITPREINFGRFGGRVLFLNYADRVSEFIAARICCCSSEFFHAAGYRVTDEFMKVQSD
jgi:hypothetical protein